MLTEAEAEELYSQLIVLLEEDEWQGRFRSVLGEVRAAVAGGKPARAEIAVAIAGKRRREVVRRVEPLTSREQLEILVGALEFSLVTPVDLARQTMIALSIEDAPVEALAFERDSADIAPSDPENTNDERTRQQPSTAGAVVITASDAEIAATRIEPLRIAIGSIRSELAE